MKKYKEPINRSIRALTNKSRSGATGIGCMDCDLVFEKQELLKLHMLTHATSSANRDEEQFSSLGLFFCCWFFLHLTIDLCHSTLLSDPVAMNEGYWKGRC